MKHRFIFFSGLFGFLGVATGAFGAHGLKETLSPELLTTFQTGSRYVLVHAVVLAFVGGLASKAHHKYIERAGWSFVVGMTIFGGTLWTLALTEMRWLGAITPLGGLLLIFGWIHLMLLGLFGWSTDQNPESFSEGPAAGGSSWAEGRPSAEPPAEGALLLASVGAWTEFSEASSSVLSDPGTTSTELSNSELSSPSDSWLGKVPRNRNHKGGANR